MKRIWNWIKSKFLSNTPKKCPFCGRPSLDPIIDQRAGNKVNVCFVACCDKMKRALVSMIQTEKTRKK